MSFGNDFIVRRGGGGASSYTVAVKYPQGMTCTCAGKSAKDTSGFAIFPVSGAGTYTVVVTNGTSSATKTAVLTNSQKCVVLDFDDFYTIFRSEVNYSDDVCGGWIGTAQKRSASGTAATVFHVPTFVDTSNALSFTFTSLESAVSSGLVHTIEPLNFTEGNYLAIAGSYTLNAGGAGWRYVDLDVLILSDTLSDYVDNAVAYNNFYHHSANATPSSGTIDVLIPLNEISGYHRIGFGFMLQNRTEYTVDITALEII